MRDMQTYDTAHPKEILDRVWEKLMDMDMAETDQFNPNLNNQPNWSARCTVARLRYELSSKVKDDLGDFITEATQ